MKTIKKNIQDEIENLEPKSGPPLSPSGKATVIRTNQQKANISTRERMILKWLKSHLLFDPDYAEVEKIKGKNFLVGLKGEIQVNLRPNQDFALGLLTEIKNEEFRDDKIKEERLKQVRSSLVGIKRIIWTAELSGAIDWLEGEIFRLNQERHDKN